MGPIIRRFQPRRAPGGRNVRNEANSSIADCGLGMDPRRRDRSCKTNPIWPPGANCAKRSQFGAGGQAPAGSNVQNEPNSRRCRVGPSQGPWDAGQSCKTKPILPERPGMGAGCRGRETPLESDCAKRSQTWEDWGVWVKAVIVRGAASPEGETCKTNPIFQGWYE